MRNAPLGNHAPSLALRGRLGGLAKSLLLVALSFAVLLVTLFALASSASAP